MILIKKIFKNIKAIFTPVFSCLNIFKTKRLFKTFRFNFLFLMIISLIILIPFKIYFYPPDVSPNISLQETKAAGITWDGSESSDWTVGANWIGDTAPISTDDVIIDGGYTHAPTLDLTSGITTINSLSLGATAASTVLLQRQLILEAEEDLPDMEQEVLAERLLR